MCPHAGIYRAVSSFFECWDLGLVRDNQYVIQFQLIEVEVLVQIEVSDSCSDVQKLFSVTDGRNIMYKESSAQNKKNTKYHNWSEASKTGVIPSSAILSKLVIINQEIPS